MAGSSKVEGGRSLQKLNELEEGRLALERLQTNVPDFSLLYLAF